jgi:hypothetical protein
MHPLKIWLLSGLDLLSAGCIGLSFDNLLCNDIFIVGTWVTWLYARMPYFIDFLLQFHILTAGLLSGMQQRSTIYHYISLSPPECCSGLEEACTLTAVAYLTNYHYNDESKTLKNAVWHRMITNDKNSLCCYSRPMQNSSSTCNV